MPTVRDLIRTKDNPQIWSISPDFNRLSKPYSCLRRKMSALYW